MPAKRLLLLLSALSIAMPALSADTDPVKARSDQAQKRVDAWDREDQAQAKRDNWEIPVVSALTFVGSAFATRSKPFIYAASGVAALGLTWHFATHHRATDVVPPENDADPTPP